MNFARHLISRLRGTPVTDTDADAFALRLERMDKNRAKHQIGGALFKNLSSRRAA